MLPPKSYSEQKAKASSDLLNLGKQASKLALETKGNDLSLILKFNEMAKAEGCGSIMKSPNPKTWGA